MNGNYNNKFDLNIETGKHYWIIYFKNSYKPKLSHMKVHMFVSGELTVRYYPESPRQSRIRRQAVSNPANNIFVLTVRAYDLGKTVRFKIIVYDD